MTRKEHKARCKEVYEFHKAGRNRVAKAGIRMWKLTTRVRPNINALRAFYGI